MHLTNKEIIAKPIDQVFKLVRDDLAKLVPYMPNINKIDVKSRKENGDVLELVNHWFAKADMPSLLKKFINPDIFSWKDTAIWRNKDFCVDYKLESFLANDLFDAHGTNTFKSVGDNKTELVVSCHITIYPEKVPGVPRLLAKQITPAIESLLEKILAPNMTSLGKGLNDYFGKNP